MNLNLRKDFTLILFLLFSTTGLMVWVRALTVKATYQYVGLEKELKILELESQERRVRWLKMTAPKKLEALANKLGLEAPKLGQTLKTDTSNIVADLNNR